MAFTQLGTRARPIYVDAGAIAQLRRVAGIVFDCDGVLIDTRSSYDIAIQRTVAYLFRRLTGSKLPRDIAKPLVKSPTARPPHP